VFSNHILVVNAQHDKETITISKDLFNKFFKFNEAIEPSSAFKKAKHDNVANTKTPIKKHSKPPKVIAHNISMAMKPSPHIPTL
jgi:plasmid replication initiation protein